MYLLNINDRWEPIQDYNSNLSHDWFMKVNAYHNDNFPALWTQSDIDIFIKAMDKIYQKYNETWDSEFIARVNVMNDLIHDFTKEVLDEMMNPQEYELSEDEAFTRQQNLESELETHLNELKDLENDNII